MLSCLTFVIGKIQITQLVRVYGFNVGWSIVLVLENCNNHPAGPRAVTVGQHLASKDESNTNSLVTNGQ
jgi:hypothetical protein